MKKYLIGAMTGSVVTASLLLGATAFADSSITAAVQNIKYLFDGQQKYLSDGYTSIMYNNHVYVPARFVAENLGAKVGWDNNTQTVIIQTGSTLAGTPQAMPVSSTQQLTTVTVESATKQSGQTVFNVKVTNNSVDPITLVVGDSQVVVNGKQTNYEIKMDGSDSQWTNRIQPGASMEGTITLPVDTSSASSAVLYIPFMSDNPNTSSFTESFNVQLSN